EDTGEDRIVLDDEEEGPRRLPWHRLMLNGRRGHGRQHQLAIGRGRLLIASALPPRHPRLARLARLGVRVDRQEQREGAALARLAPQPDLAAEKGRQLAADRQSEPSAAIATAGRAV